MPRNSWCPPAVWLCIGLVSLALCGCGKAVSYQAPASRACPELSPAAAQASRPRSAHLPLPADILEDRMRTEPFTVLEASGTDGGTTSAMRLRIQFADCTTLAVKWRAAPPSGDAYNNNPRKELAAYAIQKLFLEPPDYVVPVTVLTCIPQAQLAKMGAPGTPQLDGTDCVFGTLAIWLDNVTVPKRLVDLDRFAATRAAGQGGYAWHLANLNVLTYLISHRDGRPGNFLSADHPESQRLFAVDNGLAFGGLGNPRRLFDPFILHMNRLKVDHLPRQTVQRLRHITSASLYEHLGTVAEIRLDATGQAHSLAIFSPNLDPDAGVRRAAGVIQLGLKSREIAKVAQRLRILLDRVEAGDLQLF